MDKSRFSIFEAVKNAYAFVGREWLYLLKAGLLPIGAQIATGLSIQYQRPDASTVEVYLWGLPAVVLFAWFMFLETRLLLLGERLDRLPKDPHYLADRQHAMKLSVITAVLFNMGTAAAQMLLMTIEEASQAETSWPLNIGGLLLIGAIVWAVRFGIVPTLAAVHYPIRPVLRQTWGMLFSLRLVAMGILCVLPVGFVFWLILTSVVPIGTDPEVPIRLTPAQQSIGIIATAPLSLLFAALLSASVAYALKKILGPKRDNVVI